LIAKVNTRLATPDDLGKVRDFYARFDYARHVSVGDTILIAERQGEICAALRLAVEHGVLLLRGMRVAAEMRRQGIGAQLLHAAVPVIGGRECFCVPLSHLVGFYGQIGFVEIEPENAPGFLQERLTEYQEDLGLEVVVMRRARG
jgi:N-acetylglutamate synthase-like GNAT family acetyltransferase